MEIIIDIFIRLQCHGNMTSVLFVIAVVYILKTKETLLTWQLEFAQIVCTISKTSLIRLVSTVKTLSTSNVAS